MNETFEFGFAADEIVAREDISTGTRSGVDPHGVLIDNAAEFGGDTSHYSRRAQKLRYLGIGATAVVEVPYFRGETNGSFEAKWKRYVADVRGLVTSAPNRAKYDVGAKAHPGNEEYYRRRLRDLANDVDG